MSLTEPLLDALRSFVSTMAKSYDSAEMCYQLCDHAAEIFGVSGAGVGVADDHGNLRFVTATSERIVEIEKIQEEVQEGPCVEAFTTQDIVCITEIQQVDHWPEYKATAMRVGVHSVMGVPLSVDSTRLGAFNIYHEEPRIWTDEERSIASVLSDMATAYLLRTTELTEAQKIADQLQAALDSRVVIEQAKGIVAGERGIGVDQAFQMIRQHARNNNQSLGALAEAVVNMGLRLPELAPLPSSDGHRPGVRVHGR